MTSKDRLLRRLNRDDRRPIVLSSHRDNPPWTHFGTNHTILRSLAIIRLWSFHFERNTEWSQIVYSPALSFLQFDKPHEFRLFESELWVPFSSIYQPTSKQICSFSFKVVSIRPIPMATVATGPNVTAATQCKQTLHLHKLCVACHESRVSHFFPFDD